MISISTFNGKSFLPNLLEDIQKFNIPNNEVCITNNKSTDEEFVSYLHNLQKDGYNILHNPKSTYDLGAHKYALDNFKNADYWFCFSDSIRLKNDIFSYIKPKLTNNNVYTFVTFRFALYDNIEDISFLLLHYGTSKYSLGIAGAMMFALNSVLQEVKNEWYLPINNKESATTDRGISIIFDNHNIKIMGLDNYLPEKFNDPEAYYYFKKTYGNRY